MRLDYGDEHPDVPGAIAPSRSEIVEEEIRAAIDACPHDREMWEELNDDEWVCTGCGLVTDMNSATVLAFGGDA